jgi:hypothetical protein
MHIHISKTVHLKDDYSDEASSACSGRQRKTLRKIGAHNDSRTHADDEEHLFRMGLPPGCLLAEYFSSACVHKMMRHIASLVCTWKETGVERVAKTYEEDTESD